MLEYHQLTDLDFRLLEAVEGSGSIAVLDLLARFENRDTTSLRIDILSKPDRLHVHPHIREPIPNTFYIEKNGMGGSAILRITPLGEKALEEWRMESAARAKRTREERLFKTVPIMISLLALVLSIISLLQSLQWIDISKAGILP